MLKEAKLEEMRSTITDLTVRLHKYVLSWHRCQITRKQYTAKKDCYLAIIFFSRVATVCMVLWNDTLVHVITRYGQYGAHGVATGIIEFATRGLFRHQISAIIM